MSTHLDIELLRALVAIADTGGFTRAAEALHRTQSAISLQMKRLESQARTSLFQREGRQMRLTEAGHRLLGYARRILAYHDEALAALSDNAVEGRVRFGTAQDFTALLLPNLLTEFSRRNPRVQLEMHVDSNAGLVQSLHRGQLDLALVLQETGQGGSVLAQLPRVWLAPADRALEHDDPLPLVLFESPCLFRAIMLEHLDAAERRRRVVFTSPGLDGILAAVRAGLGITARTTLSLGAGLRIADAMAGLPPLPDMEIALHRAPASEGPAIELLAATTRAGLSAFPTGGQAPVRPSMPHD